MARSKRSYDLEDDWDQTSEFIGSLSAGDGKILAANIPGCLRKIDGIPVRFEGELIIPYRWTARADRAWNEPILLVTDDDLHLLIQTRQIRIVGRETVIIFTGHSY